MIFHGKANRLANGILDRFKHERVHIVLYVRVPLEKGRHFKQISAVSLNKWCCRVRNNAKRGQSVSLTCEPVWPSGKSLVRLVSRKTSVRFCFGTPLPLNVVVCGDFFAQQRGTDKFVSKTDASRPNVSVCQCVSVSVPSLKMLQGLVCQCVST